jgi:methyl-accepting chemotaxis protein
MESALIAQTEEMTTSLKKEAMRISSSALTKGDPALGELGEWTVREKARDVARQIEMFMKYHPLLKPPSLYASQELNEIAVQPVWKTGYTAVHDIKAVSRFHKDAQIVGMDFHNLAEKYPAFWRILESSLTGEASGYYEWPERDGTIRSKYMFVVPVEGTDLRVAATAYVDEFSAPVKQMESKFKEGFARSEKVIRNSSAGSVEKFRVASQWIRKHLLIIVGLCLAAVTALVYWYSRIVVRPIILLSQMADQVSMGNLDAKIAIDSYGEIGILAESFSRMRDNLKTAIERLKRRRQQTDSIGRAE